jgi:four helix bundle protein
MMPQKILAFSEWGHAARVSRAGDPLWSVQAYRLSLYAIYCHLEDRRARAQFARAASITQLTRALGSIAANIAEGYSRSTPPDRANFYGYALGSTREAIAWYDTLRLELRDQADARQATLISIRRLLLTTLKRMRGSTGRASLID